MPTALSILAVTISKSTRPTRKARSNGPWPSGNGFAPSPPTRARRATFTVQRITPGRLYNLSVRTTAGTGAQTLIVGFTVAGSPDKPVLIRAIGPSLTQFGVSGVLGDPRLQLFSDATVLTANDDWASPVGGGGSAAIANAFAVSGAFPLDVTSKDAALVRTMSAGSYTAQVTRGGTTGN